MEHKKLWSKRYVRITVWSIFVYVIVLGGILQYQWMQFGTWKNGASYNADGYEYIRLRQEQARGYGGSLTDEVLQEMARDYQRLSATDGGSGLELLDTTILNAWLGILYPELRDASRWEPMAHYVDTGKLTDLYQRRKEAIMGFMDASGIEDKERELLISMNDKVAEPFTYRWTEGWSFLLGDMLPDLGIMMGIGIVICLAPFFSDEWHERTGAMILSMRRGWREDAVAKILVGFWFTVELFVLLAVGCIVLQYIYLGTEGYDMPIQCIKMIAIAPMNMLEAEGYEYLFALTSSLGVAGLTMLFSANSKNNLLSLICGALLLILPLILEPYLPYQAQMVMSLIPLAGSAADIFRTYTLTVFGYPLWMPYVMPVAAILWAVLSVPGIIRAWAKRMDI